MSDYKDMLEEHRRFERLQKSNEGHDRNVVRLQLCAEAAKHEFDKALLENTKLKERIKVLETHIADLEAR